MKIFNYLHIVIVLSFMFCACTQDRVLTDKNGSYYLENKLYTGIVREYYSNRNKAYEGKVLDGLKSGKWLWYYENGQARLEENYVNGKHTGKKTAWNEEGKVISMAKVQ